MSQIQGFQNHAEMPQQPANVQQADIPEVFQHARPSSTPIGRILLGVVTLGISEGIRALVHLVQRVYTEVRTPQLQGCDLPPAWANIDMHNSELFRQMNNNGLSPAEEAAIKRDLDTLREQFGEQFVPRFEEGADLAQVLQTNPFSKLPELILNSHAIVTPPVLSDLLATLRPELTTMFNAELARNLKNSDFSPEYTVAIKEALNELRDAFGKQAVPPFEIQADFIQVLRDISFYPIPGLIKTSREVVTPESLKELILKLRPELTMPALRTCIEEYCKSHNYMVNVLGLSSTIVPSGSERKTVLEACKNMDEVRAFFNSCEEAPAKLSRTSAMNRIEQEAKDLIWATLSREAGIPLELLRAKIDLRYLEDKCAYISVDNNISIDEAKQKYTKETDTFINNKTALLYTLKEASLPNTLETEMIDELLCKHNLKAEAFAKYLSAAKLVDASPLLALLQDGKMTANEISPYLGILGLKLEQAIEDRFSKKELLSLGADGQNNARNYCMEFVLHQTPGLLDALRDLPVDIKQAVSELTKERYENGMRDMANPLILASPEEAEEARTRMLSGLFAQLANRLIDSPQMTPADLADSITTNGIPLAYAAAIHSELEGIRADFKDTLPESNNLAAWRTDEKSSARAEKLQARIRALPHTPSPANVGNLLREVVLGSVQS